MLFSSTLTSEVGCSIKIRNISGYLHTSDPKSITSMLSEEFQEFVQRVNSQIRYNTNGKINAIPIITYHNLTNSMQDYNNMTSTITVDLFAQQMKYLHDNGFRVLLLNQLSYDPNNKVFVLKDVPLSSYGI